MIRQILCLTVLLSPALLEAQTAAPAAAPVGEGAPVTISRSQQWDIVSKINAQTYRIMVAAPLTTTLRTVLAQGKPAAPSPKTDVSHPVVYVLDGNAYFGLATDVMARLSFGGEAVAAIVVGIGYPSDDPGDWIRRRAFDLTASASPSTSGGAGQVYGGAEVFFRLIEDQIKPLIASRYRVDATRQVLYGQSYGGQFALRVLFRDPRAFSAYIVSSPSIWWNEKEVLADERAFAERARAGEVRAKVLLTSAGDEQYRGTDPELLAAAQRNRLVDNAAELFDRLVRLHPQNLTVTRVVFDGETHGSVPPSSLTRGLRFALAPK